MKTSKFSINNKQIESEFEKKLLDTDSKNITFTCEEGKDYNEKLSNKSSISQSSLKRELYFT